MIGVAHSAIFCIDKISFSSLFQSELFNETINSDETLKIHLWMPDPSFESWPPAVSSANPWKICSNLRNSWPVVTDRNPLELAQYESILSGPLCKVPQGLMPLKTLPVVMSDSPDLRIWFSISSISIHIDTEKFIFWCFQSSLDSTGPEDKSWEATYLVQRNFVGQRLHQFGIQLLGLLFLPNSLIEFLRSWRGNLSDALLRSHQLEKAIWTLKISSTKLDNHNRQRPWSLGDRKKETLLGTDVNSWERLRRKAFQRTSLPMFHGPKSTQIRPLQSLQPNKYNVMAKTIIQKTIFLDFKTICQIFPKSETKKRKFLVRE